MQIYPMKSSRVHDVQDFFYDYPFRESGLPNFIGQLIKHDGIYFAQINRIMRPGHVLFEHKF
jgi:hypothetical protein